VNIASRAGLGQWLVLKRRILLSTEGAWNKEGVAWSQMWLPYHLPEGYLGVTGVRGEKQNKSNRMLGNSPRRWRRSRAYIDITHTLELKHTTLPISRSTVSLRDLFVLQIKPSIARISFFLFFAVQCSNVRMFLFSFTNFIIYIKIWHIPKTLWRHNLKSVSGTVDFFHPSTVQGYIYTVAVSHFVCIIRFLTYYAECYTKTYKKMNKNDR
jgi:hypothetical protein